jgi:FtsH-binding integral membrane protein
MENQPVEQNNSPMAPTPEQPVNVNQIVTPQPIAQPQAQQPAQYMMHQKTLNGVDGGLICYLATFVLASLSFITAFFAAISDLTSSTSVVTAIFSPLIAAGAIASVILIAMQRKLGKMVSVATIGLSGLYFAINIIVLWLSNQQNMPIAILIGLVLSALVAHGFLILYFFVSRRVSQTLIK